MLFALALPISVEPGIRGTNYHSRFMNLCMVRLALTF